MNKDWIGSNGSLFKIIGASNHTDKEREQNDYYATDPIAINELLKATTLPNGVIWECACGGGDLSKRLMEYEYEVYSTDLIDRGFGESGIDFLQTTSLPENCHCILTNPLYKYAQAFVEHALDIMEPGDKIFMFLKLTFLEGKARRKLFDTKQLKTLYVSTTRILCAKNGDFDYMKQHGGSAVAYGWYEWEKDYKGNPEIKWIN